MRQLSSPGTTAPRNYNVDLIKLLSCLAVIGLHVFYNKNSVASSVIYYLCGFSVPSFFMSTGYFVMNRQTADRTYAVRKFLGLLQDRSAFGPAGLARAVVRSIIQKGGLWDTMWHFWYLAALMILYLLLPLLYRLYVGDQSPDDRFSSLFRLWAGLALVGILAQLISYCIGQPFQKFFCQTFRLWTWLQYLVLGGLAPRLRTAAEKRLPLLLHGLCLFLITVYVMVYQNIVGRGLLHNLYAEYFYDDAFTVFWVLLLYTFLLRVPIPRLLHRILEVRPDGYVLCGDNRRQREYGVRDRHMVGILTAVIRDGKKTISVTDPVYRLYVHLWCDLFPIRAAALFGKTLPARIRRKLFF